MYNDIEEGIVLYSAQWTLLEQLFLILDPFIIATKGASAAETPAPNKVILLICLLKRNLKKMRKTQTSAMFTLTFTVFLSIYPPMTNWQPWKGQRWYFSYTIRPLLPRKKEKKNHLLDEKRHRQGINGQFSNWWNGDRQSHKEPKSKDFTSFLSHLCLCLQVAFSMELLAEESSI